MRLHKIIFALLLLVTVSVGCAILDAGSSIPRQHEEKLSGMPDCLECHKEDETLGNKPVSAYRHNATFYDRHGDIAAGYQAVCESCHKAKFCSDCHAVKEEISPSRKLGNQPDRSSPHRGDYFNTHKIEGRVRRAECFKCHGRRNNVTCKRCHNP